MLISNLLWLVNVRSKFNPIVNVIINPIIIITRELAVSGYRLIAVEKGGKVIAASVWGKLKTVTQMIAIILAFIDVNKFGAIFSGNLTGFDFTLNLISTIIMIFSVIATIFSGWDYLKNGKELLK